jgi:hypothetical protein
MMNGMLAYETNASGFDLPEHVAGDHSIILDSHTQSLGFRIPCSKELSEDAVVLSYLL